MVSGLGGEFLKSYNVKEIANALNTNQETVRRWIRSGKLGAEQGSRKVGNIITEDALLDFVKEVPKYTSLVAALTGALPLALGSLVGSVIATMYASPERIGTPEKIREYYVKDIEKTQESVVQKRMAIKQLQQDLEADLKHIEECQQILENVDFEEVSKKLIDRAKKGE